METAILSSFVRNALAEKRIRFGDVRRLRRTAMPFGIASRDEAAALLALDRSIPKADPIWGEFLVDAIRDFLIDRCEPAGILDDAKAEWLVAAIGTPPTRNGQALAHEILNQTSEVLKVFEAFPALASDDATDEDEEAAFPDAAIEVRESVLDG